MNSEEKNLSAYEAAGVSIDAGNRAVHLMRESVRSTYTPEVLAGVGSFGGVYDISSVCADMVSPALVASTDGVGTKVKIAAEMGRFDTIGQDLVNHCINDILVQGARPLFFLDYVASSRLDPEMVAQVVSGIARACREAGCALLGGETAEMPGVYREGEFDLVGTIVGIVERENLLPRPDIIVGDVVLGLPSSGPHTNGYSLIRHIFAGIPWTTPIDGVGVLGEVLLEPHRSYLRDFDRLVQHVRVKAMAHITGGGLSENVPRVLPPNLDAHIDTCRWEVPTLFRVIQERGNVAIDEMYRVFNMGVGMVVIMSAEDAPKALRLGLGMCEIGRLELGTGQVILR